MAWREQARAEVDAFLAQVSSMAVDDFAVVDTLAMRDYEICKQARPLLKLSAADFTWVDKRSHDAVGTLLGSLAWPDEGLAVMAIATVGQASKAIMRRDRLSPEQYEAFVGGFRQAGLTIPPHPSQVGGQPVEGAE